jgi:hypothetical protein
MALDVVPDIIGSMEEASARLRYLIERVRSGRIVPRKSEAAWVRFIRLLADRLNIGLPPGLIFDDDTMRFASNQAWREASEDNYRIIEEWLHGLEIMVEIDDQQLSMVLDDDWKVKASTYVAHTRLPPPESFGMIEPPPESAA